MFRNQVGWRAAGCGAGTAMARHEARATDNSRCARSMTRTSRHGVLRGACSKWSTPWRPSSRAAVRSASRCANPAPCTCCCRPPLTPVPCSPHCSSAPPLLLDTEQDTCCAGHPEACPERAVIVPAQTVQDRRPPGHCDLWADGRRACPVPVHAQRVRQPQVRHMHTWGASGSCPQLARLWGCGRPQCFAGALAWPDCRTLDQWTTPPPALPPRPPHLLGGARFVYETPMPVGRLVRQVADKHQVRRCMGPGAAWRMTRAPQSAALPSLPPHTCAPPFGAAPAARRSARSAAGSGRTAWACWWPGTTRRGPTCTTRAPAATHTSTRPSPLVRGRRCVDGRGAGAPGGGAAGGAVSGGGRRGAGAAGM